MPGSKLKRVVIAGRPNVGKSTLFNRIAGKRRALTHDLPGMTRDRLSDVVTLDDGRRFERLLPMSAEHGEGLDELLDVINEVVPSVVPAILPAEGDDDAEEAVEVTSPIRVAIIGRPNVGKSSLLNRLLNEERAVVSP